MIVLKNLRLNPGSIVAADAAYNDFAIYSAWTEQGIHFVTRMRSNAVYEVVGEAAGASESQHSV